MEDFLNGINEAVKMENVKEEEDYQKQEEEGRDRELELEEGNSLQQNSYIKRVVQFHGDNSLQDLYDYTAEFSMQNSSSGNNSGLGEQGLGLDYEEQPPSILSSSSNDSNHLDDQEEFEEEEDEEVQQEEMEHENQPSIVLSSFALSCSAEEANINSISTSSHLIDHHNPIQNVLSDRIFGDAFNPPSSLFEYSGVGNGGESASLVAAVNNNSNDPLMSSSSKSNIIVNYTIMSFGISEMITPCDDSLKMTIKEAKVMQVAIPTPKPGNRLIKFVKDNNESYEVIEDERTPQPSRKMKSNDEKDPFLDFDPSYKRDILQGHAINNNAETKDSSSKSKFVIKSPFSSNFKSFLPPMVAKETTQRPVKEFDNRNDPEPFVTNAATHTEDKIEEAFAVDEDEDDGEATISGGDTASWLGKNVSPLDIYNEMNSNNGGSRVLDDFFQLKKEMDEKLSIEDSFIEDDFKSVGNRSIGEDSVFSSNDIIKDLDEVPTEFSSILPASSSHHEQQTPQTNTRTLQSMSEDIFSPGSFFASRSGQLGDLESRDQQSRPTWYTPKHDGTGRLIDPIGKTPGDRIEKSNSILAETPAGKRSVRRPLYIHKSAPEEPIVTEDKVMISVDAGEMKSPLQKSSSVLDPFNWQEALDGGVDVSRSSSKTTSTCQGSKNIEINLSRKAPVNIRVTTHERSPIRIKITILNDFAKSLVWTLKAMGPASLVVNNSNQLVTESILKTEISQGKLDSLQQQLTSILFLPIINGNYTSLYHLKTAHGLIPIWINAISGHRETASVVEVLNRFSLDCSFSSTPSVTVDPNVVSSSDLSLSISQTDHHNHLAREHSIVNISDRSSSTHSIDMAENGPSPSKVVDLPVQPPFTPNLMETPRPTKSSQQHHHKVFSTGKKLTTPKTTRHTLDFEFVKKGGSKVKNLKVCNPGQKDMTISILVTGNFAIPLHEITLTPRSYFILPVCFLPSRTGNFDERLILNRKGSQSIRIDLIGSTTKGSFQNKK